MCTIYSLLFLFMIQPVGLLLHSHITLKSHNYPFPSIDAIYTYISRQLIWYYSIT